MKRSWQEVPNMHSFEKIMRERAIKELADKIEKENAASKLSAQNVRINASGDATYTLESLPMDMVHLGGENFVKVSCFLGQTRVHIRRHVCDEDGYYHPTKDGISLSPKVWLSFCTEVNHILNHRSSDKVFVIDRDLSVSKQMKAGFQLFVFQRLFQRKNLCMQFVPDCVVLRGPELVKLADRKNFITECVKSDLITYTLFNNITREVNKSNPDLKPRDDSDGFLQLIESLGKCLCAAISLKINELVNCFGCSDHFQADFMHDCLSKSRADKFAEYFDQALLDRKSVV